MSHTSISKRGTSEEFYLQVARGDIYKHTIVRKFGGNSSTGTSFVPVTLGGVFPTPQTAITLRVKAGGNAADTAAGAGAREVTLIGVDGNGAYLAETLATAGASASAATTNAFLRLTEIFVSKSGTYASATSGSHVGDIVIEDSGGGEDWGNIDASEFPNGISEIGAYTVPLGFTAYVLSARVSTDAGKSADIIQFVRQNILETSAPYSPMVGVVHAVGVSGDQEIPVTIPGPVPALADAGFMAKVASGTAAVHVEFEMLLIEDDDDH